MIDALSVAWCGLVFGIGVPIDVWAGELADVLIVVGIEILTGVEANSSKSDITVSLSESLLFFSAVQT